MRACARRKVEPGKGLESRHVQPLPGPGKGQSGLAVVQVAIGFDPLGWKTADESLTVLREGDVEPIVPAVDGVLRVVEMIGSDLDQRVALEELLDDFDAILPLRRLPGEELGGSLEDPVEVRALGQQHAAPTPVLLIGRPGAPDQHLALDRSAASPPGSGY